ncbi:MAG: PfkB family carbohydrate kinase [Pseudomonadota bacterium]
MTAPARLLQLSGVVIDLIYHVDALPEQGGEAMVNKFQTAPGGGFNAMVAARRSKMDVTYAGAIGAGPFGDMVANALAAEGIDRLRPRAPKGCDQGCCTVMIEPSGERTFVAAEGVEGQVTPMDLDRLYLPEFGWSLLSGYALYYQGSREAFASWLTSDVAIPNLVFDPSPLVASIQADLRAAALARAVWVSANAAEAAILTGNEDPETAARALAEGRPAHGGAVVRTGADGCVIATGGEAQIVPAHRVQPVDTNGAGDTHLGAFIAALARGEPPLRAALCANVAAALSTTAYGPATAPNLATINRMLKLRQAG